MKLPASKLKLIISALALIIMDAAVQASEYFLKMSVAGSPAPWTKD